MTAWLSGYFGRKRYFTTSIVVFTVASFFCGASSTLPTLVFWRIVQGIGGGALLSTSQAVTELSGRGVGLDVVAERVRSLGGAIEMSTTEGAGTTFTLRVPVTLALAHALRIRVGGEEYAMPLTNISEVILLEGDGVTAGRRGAVRVRDDLVPLIDLGGVLGAPRTD